MTYIVFEGIDGAGKTTIAKALSAATGIPYWDSWMGKAVPSLPGANDFCEDLAVMDFLAQTGYSAICDRGIVSAHVYRTLENRQTLSFPDLGMLWNYAPDDTVYIRVRRPPGQCRLDRFPLHQLMLIDKLFDEAEKYKLARICSLEIDNIHTVETAVDTLLNSGKVHLW